MGADERDDGCEMAAVDGSGTDEPVQDKKAMLAAAKEAMGDTKPQGVDHKVSGLKGESVTISAATLPDPKNTVLAFEGNEGCTFVLPDGIKLVKVLISDCVGCTIKIQPGVTLLTSVVEIWQCTDFILSTGVSIGTLQIDLCMGRCAVQFADPGCLGQMVQAGVEHLAVNFGSNPGFDFVTGADEIRKSLKPDLAVGDRFTQFTTRIIDGAPLTEEIIRLANDFPTTVREKAIHDTNILKKEAAMREMAESMLSGVGGSLDSEQKEEVARKLAESEAKMRSDLDAGTGDEARAEYKRGLGTEQFKIGDFQQAAVHYTESIDLKNDVPAVWANRAMCWLKLAQSDKALTDCDRCIALDPSYAKAHFRRGVALLEMGNYVEACKAFRKTLDLDPKNAQAKSSMMLAEKKMAMQMAKSA